MLFLDIRANCGEGIQRAARLIVLNCVAILASIIGFSFESVGDLPMAYITTSRPT